MKRAAFMMALVVVAGCRPPPGQEVASPSLVVLPLENVSADPEESDYLAQGISRAVSAKLAQAGLRVTPWDTARRYAEDSVEGVARKLKVDAVLSGTFELVEDRMLVTLSLVNARSGRESWADSFEEPFEDVFEVQRRIALGAARSLKRELSREEETALAVPESRSAEAYDQYMQGAHVFQQGGEEASEIASRYFDRALAVDPDLSEAHMALGAVHYARYYYGWGGDDSFDEAQARYRAALALEPENLRARRGIIYLTYFRGPSEEALAQGQLAARYARSYDWELALTQLIAYSFGGLRERLLPIVRDLETAEVVDAEVLYSLAVHTWGEANDVTIAAGSRYLDHFGADPEIHEYIAFAHIFRGELEQARVQYDRALALVEEGVGFPEPFFYAGFLHDRLGDAGEAEAIWRRGLAIVETQVASRPDSVRLRLWQACLRGLSGNAAFAIETADDVLASKANSYELQYLAIVLAWLGDEERAVALLRASMRRGLLDPSWSGQFDVTFVSRDGPGFESFAEELESALVPLREKY
jgi:TolB-like protein